MRKVILFGSTGHPGKAIAKELIKEEYDLTIVVRNNVKAKSIAYITTKYIIADVCNQATLKQILNDQEN